MPKLFAYDDYDECFNGYSSLDPMYCVVRSVIKPNNRSDLWNLIEIFSNDTYRHFRHNHLDRGICVERCRRALVGLQNDTLQQLYVDKFQIDFAYIMEPAAFENGAKDRSTYGQLINVCVNHELNRSHNLSAYSEIEYCTRPERRINLDLLDLSFIAVSLLLIFLVMASSWFDHQLNLRQHEADHYRKNLACSKNMLFTAFSLKRNWHRLTGQSRDQLNEDLRFFQTIRFLTFCLVVMSHCWINYTITPVHNPYTLEQTYYSPARHAVINGGQILQTFFLFSGFLLSLHFFNTRTQLRGRSLGWGVVLVVVFYRFVRLTPVYAYVLLLHATWLAKFQDGPLWKRGVDPERYFCRKNWWTNLLYANNYVHVEEPCIQASWYLATDFQLFTLGMILVVAVVKYPRLKFKLYSLAAAVSFILPALVIYFGEFDGTFIVRLQDQRFYYWYDRMYREVYIPTHTNMGCYLGGIILGAIYYSQRKNHAVGNRAWYLQLLWYIVVPVGFLTMMSNVIFYQNNFEKPSLWMALFYPAMKNSWVLLGAISLYGMIYEYNKLVKDFLSSSFFVPLGRLSYCAYVCHMALLKLVFFGTRETRYFGQMALISSTIMVVILSYAFALILALLLELPVTAIQKYLFAGNLENGIKSDHLRSRHHNEINDENDPQRNFAVQ
uniref:Nose resistant to fluoxetine protein 6 n=6 Tax=Culex pipiens TaxID=7175 RepID=A0A8D8L8R5_CULPI